MLVSIGRRLIHVALVIVIVTFATMVLVDAVPGGIEYAILGESASPEQIRRLSEQLNLDDGYLERYAKWIGDVTTGDLGTSPRTNRSVLEVITSRLPVTIEVLALTQSLALLVGIPVGLIAARREGGWFDRGWAMVSSFLMAIPSFVVAFILIYLFAIHWRAFPVADWTPLSEGIFTNLRSLFLPVVTLALAEIAVYTRVLRSDAVTTFRQDYILAARSRGLSPARVVFRHALRPSSLSLVTLGALSIARLIGGAVVVETIFALPGLGSLMIESVLSSDLVVVQGVVVFVALVYIGINLLLDVVYGLLDPRVRKQGA